MMKMRKRGYEGRLLGAVDDDDDVVDGLSSTNTLSTAGVVIFGCKRKNMRHKDAQTDKQPAIDRQTINKTCVYI